MPSVPYASLSDKDKAEIMSDIIEDFVRHGGDAHGAAKKLQEASGEVKPNWCYGPSIEFQIEHEGIAWRYFLRG